MLNHQNMPVFVLILLGCTTQKAHSFDPFFEKEWAGEKAVTDNERMENLVIELAIFHDIAFFRMLHTYTNTNILNYWEAVVYDLHLRFKTLPNLRTSFRVTSLKFYLGDYHQGEPRHCKYHDDIFASKNEIQEAYRKFHTWAYQQIDEIPSFDIAILALGPYYSGINFVKNKPLLGSICRATNDTEKKWKAAAALSFQILQSPFQSPAEILAKQIAIILGAQGDSDADSAKTCSSHLVQDESCCIMSTNKFPLSKHFSYCTDTQITQKLTQLISRNKFCLDEGTSHKDPVIDSAKLFENPYLVKGYSNEEICKLLLEVYLDYDKVIVSTETECIEVVCTDPLYDHRIIRFTPMEGSLCGETNAGRCFKGMCIQHKIQLFNVGTGKCLVSEEGIFGINDKPVLQNCSQVVTQALLPVVPDGDKNKAFVIQYPYDHRDGIIAKRLSMNWNDNRMDFCSEKVSENCNDTYIRIHKLSGFRGKEFLLEVDNRGLYLHAAEDGVNVDLITDDYRYDKETRWKVLEFGKDGKVLEDSFKKCNIESYPNGGNLDVLTPASSSERKRSAALAWFIIWITKWMY